MNALANVPDWLGGGVLTIIGAVLGFFAKSMWETILSRRREGADRLDALRRLDQLLDDSQAVYASQNYMARRLMRRLEEKFPDDESIGSGFNKVFYSLFDRMDSEDRELQSLIRSTTLNSMRNLNEALHQWIRDHDEFRKFDKKSSESIALAEDLQQLELHLNQWFDKYEAIMPEDQRNSLVYLNDEYKHGEPFPSRIHESTKNMLGELS
jgi:hypothetical protein